MIRPYTRVRCADNTGARELSVIRVLASSTGTTAEIGDVFIAAVKNAIPNSGVKKGEVVRAVVVRQTKEYRRTDGFPIESEGIRDGTKFIECGNLDGDESIREEFHRFRFVAGIDCGQTLSNARAPTW